MLDPEEFKRSGPNVTAFNSLNVITSTGSPSGKPFSDFNLTYSFDNFYGEMNVNLDVTKDYTIFSVVEINFSANRCYLVFDLGGASGNTISYNFQKFNNNVMIKTDTAFEISYLGLIGDKSKFINKQIMCWSTWLDWLILWLD